jgi:hypothetical protein
MFLNRFLFLFRPEEAFFENLQIGGIAVDIGFVAFTFTASESNHKQLLDLVRVHPPWISSLVN